MSLSLLKKSMAIVDDGLPNLKCEKETNAVKRGKIRKPKEFLYKQQARKITIDEVRKQLELENAQVQRNLEKLLALSKNSVKIPNAEKIAKRATNGRYVVEKKKSVEMESLYTEEDFAMFEKELASVM